MNPSKDDLEDCMEKLRNIIYEHEDYKVNETEAWSLIDNLTKELEVCRQREQCLQENLTKCLDSENANITTKYVLLQERNETFEKDNAALSGQLYSQKTEFLRELSKLEERYKSELNVLKEQRERDRSCHEEKEKKLYDELQLAYASTALQCDEIETNLKRQLIDANNKLRNSQNTIRSLQMDINNLKTQLSNQQAQSHQRSSKPEIKFQPLPISARLSNQSFASCDEFEAEDEDFMRVPPVRPITPLERSVTPLNREFRQQTSTPVVFRGSIKAPTPTVTPQVKKIPRKRKLYDPNSFDESNVPQFQK